MGRAMRPRFGKKNSGAASNTWATGLAPRNQVCVYIHPTSGVKLLAHVDDIMAVGPENALQDLQRQLRAKYELKSQMLGPTADCAKEVEFLGRTVRWTENGLQYEAGSKHVQALLQDWNLEGCKEIGTPSVAAKGDDQDYALPEKDASRYRRGAAIHGHGQANGSGRGKIEAPHSLPSS